LLHELIHIVSAFTKYKALNRKSVLITVVDLDGSSYRKPGVRMLIHEDHTMVGAVSGGCVENEIIRQSKLVFQTGQAKIITYDGRFRLGCEGFLYILIEPFQPGDAFLEALHKAIAQRTELKLISKYKREEGAFKKLGTYVKIEDKEFTLSQNVELKDLKSGDFNTFSQTLAPQFRLIIFGSEHDAAHLTQYAALTGWRVDIIAKPSEHRSIKDFPGASSFTASQPEQLHLSDIDPQTAVMIMTHSFSSDLKALIALKDCRPAYIGLLGPIHKRENLLSQLMTFNPDLNEHFLNSIYGPAGLNIGSETPQEIAISIISEILSVLRKKKPISLREKTGHIHV
jgi:xanthine dehydrogenase accessory factor